MVSRRLGIRALERRIVFDAAAAASVAAAVPADDHAAAASLLQTLFHDSGADIPSADHADQSLVEQVLSAPAPTPVRAQSPTAIVFVDANLPGYEQFLEQSPPGALVVMLNPREDGVAQIADTLGQYSDVHSVHIVSHGAQGELHLGSTVLDTGSLAQHADELAGWSKGLAPGADVLLYGCDIGAGSGGQVFIDGLSALIGADVAASSDATGNAELGGDWELEVHSGIIETRAVEATAYQGLLPVQPSITWDGGANTTNWSDAANWSNDTLPTVTDDVLITGATVTLSSGSYAVNTLTVVNGEVSIGGGALTVGDDISDLSGLDASSQLGISGGTLTLGGYLTVDGTYAQTGGTLGGSGTLALTSTTNTWSGSGYSAWTGGGTVVVANGASLTFSGSGVGNVFSGRTLSIASGGTVTVAGNIELDPGTNAINNAGTLNLNSGDIRHTLNSQGSMSIVNDGVINKNNANTFILGSTPVAEAVNLVNAGTFNLNGGTLNYVGGTGSSTGTFTVAAGATYETSGTATMVFEAGSVLSSAGSIVTSSGTTTVNIASMTLPSLTLSGGTLNVLGAVTVSTVYTQTGGTLGGAGTLTLTGATNTWSGSGYSAWTGGGTVVVANGASLAFSGSGVGNVFSGRTLNIASGGTVTVAGNIELDPGTNAINNAGTLNLNSGDIRHTLNSQGSITITNNAVINKNNANTFVLGSTPVAEAVNLVNAGTFNLNGGTLNYVGGTGSSTGTFTVAAGATYETSGTATMVFEAGSVLSSAGSMVTSSGTTTVNIASMTLPSLTLSGGTLNVLGAVTVSTVYTQTGGTLGGAGTLTLTGSTNTWSGSGYSAWTGGGTVVVANGASLAFSGSGVGNVFSGRTLNIASGGTVTVAGNIELDPGTNAINNAGTLNLNSGDIRHTLNSQGSITITNNAVINKNNANTFVLGSTPVAEAVNLVNAGTFNLNGGTLNYVGGTGSSTGTFNVAAGATYETSGTATMVFEAGSVLSSAGSMVTLSGTTTVNIASMTLPSLTLSGGTLNVLGAVTVSTVYTQTGGTLGGAGTLTLTGATNTWSGSGYSAWTGGGTVVVANGASLAFSGSGVGNVFSGRTLNIASGGTVTVAGNIELDPGTNAINNAGTLNLNSGDIRHTLNSQGSITITNNAVINKNNANTFVLGSTPVAEAVNLVNAGTFNLNGGTLNYVGGTGSSTGTFNVAAGATYETSGTTTMVFEAGSVLSSAGSIVTSSGTTSINIASASVSSLSLSGGTLNAPGSLTVSNAFTQTGGTLSGGGTLTLTGSTNIWSGSNGVWTGGGTVVVANGASLAMSGTFVGNTFAGRTLQIDAGGSVTVTGRIELDPGTNAITNAGTLTFATGTSSNFDLSQIYNLGGTLTLENSGTLVKTGTTAFTLGAVALTNTGTVNVQSGTLSYASGTGSGAGIFDISAGANLALNGVWSLDSPVNFIGAGNVDFVTAGGVSFSTIRTRSIGASVTFPGAAGPLTVDPQTPVSFLANQGTVSFDGTAFTYTPDAGATGPDQFSYTVFDTDSSTSAVAVVLVQASGNSPPSFSISTGNGVINTLNGNPTFSEGGAAVILDADVQVIDPDMAALNGGAGDYAGASLSISRSGGADVGDVFGFDTAGASFSVVGSSLQFGLQSFAVVSNTGGALTIDFTGASTPVTQALLNDVLRHITYSSVATQPPPLVSLAWSFSDGAAAATGSTTVTIAVNQSPIAINDSTAVAEDAASGNLRVALLNNDGDPDLDPVRIVSVTQGAKGSVTLDDGGTNDPIDDIVIYTADGAMLDALANGQTTTDTFSYTISDPFDATSTATVTVTITGINDAPVATDATASVLEGGTVTGTLTASDPDAGDTLSFALTGVAPAGFTLDTAGNWSFDATSQGNVATGQTLTLSVPYTVTDGAGVSSSASLVITTTGFNQAPTSSGATASVLEDGTVSGILTGSDPDVGNTLSFALTGTAPAGFTLDAAGNWSFDAAGFDSLAAGQTQILTVPYAVTDAGGLSGSANLVITITGVDDVAVLAPDAGTTTWGTPLTLDVLANDSDVDSVPQVTAVTQGTNGSVQILADGTVRYTPLPGFTGTDAFSYTVTDGGTATVSVTVTRADLVWTNATGDNNWNNPGNWDQNVTPTAIDTVVIPDTVGAPQISGNATLLSLHLSDTLTIADGTLTLTGASTIESGGNLILNGSTLAGSTVLQSTGTLTLRGGTVTLALDNAGTLIAEDGVIDQGSTDFVNTGTIVIPSGQNLQIIAGRFVNRGNVQGRGSLDVNATLFLNDGSVSPGSSPGILTVSGDYTQTATGTLNIELAGPVVGTQYDQLVVSGTATLGGNLNLILLNGFVPGPGDGIQILSAGSVVGDFATVQGLPPGVTFSLNGGFGETVQPVIPAGVVLGSTPVAVAYLGVAGLSPSVYSEGPEQSWLSTALAPPPEDYMVGDLEWQDMMEDIMATIAGQDVVLTETNDLPLAAEGQRVDGPLPDASLQQQLRAIADQFTEEQQQILEQLRAAEEVLTCP